MKLLMKQYQIESQNASLNRLVERLARSRMEGARLPNCLPPRHPHRPTQPVTHTMICLAEPIHHNTILHAHVKSWISSCRFHVFYSLWPADDVIEDPKHMVGQLQLPSVPLLDPGRPRRPRDLIAPSTSSNKKWGQWE